MGYSPPSPFKNVVEQQELQLQEPVSSRRLTGPVQFILGLLDCWKLEKKDAVYLLGFDETQSTCISEVFKGNEQLLGWDAKDRLSHLFAIRESLHYFFRDLETENDWLREPQPLLDGQIPMDLLLKGSIVDILLVREYIESMVGR
ncbi:MAG: MbcA/ParS/Xre antitoxin family protein [Gammaproteobacteria bacterium]|nr:MbcA/ParS/Xre antitoxin family protein [Gammaproteobacteria bacterium]